ncbi:hypothetical protein NESM_000253300 [Novymonas esmeraldas]|uniref:Uncharacterized protein n=1 Tax=Novymonas esmeraldas TaxID=1808958 RepID=A0AAW0FAK8_9TRYP
MSSHQLDPPAPSATDGAATAAAVADAAPAVAEDYAGWRASALVEALLWMSSEAGGGHPPPETAGSAVYRSSTPPSAASAPAVNAQHHHQQQHTPAQRRPVIVAAAPRPRWTTTHSDSEVHTHTGADVESSAATTRLGSAGLVSSSLQTPAATATQQAQRQPSSHAALSTESAGTSWEKRFAAQAQQLLRDTQQHMDELRHCEQRAAVEAQRANAAAAAQRVLEARLAEADEHRAREAAAHDAVSRELSQQVLRLEEAVGVLRRAKLDLQRDLQEAVLTAAEQQRQQQREHDRALAQAREAAEEAVAVCQSQQQQLQRGLERDLAECKAAAASLAAERDVLQARCAALDVQRDSAVPLESVHRDVLVQWQLREQTMLSQLTMADARLRDELQLRRAAEDRARTLLEETTRMAERLAAAEAAATHAEQQRQAAEDAAAAAAAAAVETGKSQSREMTLHAEVQQQELLEAQTACAALRRENVAVVTRHQLAQRQQEERWTTVRAAVDAALRAAGLHDDGDGEADAHPETPSSDLAESTAQTVLRALDTLATAVRLQQDTAASPHAAELEQRRLSVLEDALRAEDTQNKARLSSLEAAEAQLHESRRELAAWRRRQLELTTRQEAHETACQAAQAQMASVAALVQRALREYTPSLCGGRSRSSRTADAGAADGVRGELHGAIDVGTAPPSTASAPWEEASVVTEVELEGGDAVGAASRRRGAPLPSLSASATSSADLTVASAPHNDEDDDDGGAVSAGLPHAALALRHSVLKLLAAWRTRQHTLVAAHESMQRRLTDAVAASTAAAAQQQEAEARHQQQRRLSRAADQRRTQELEQLQRELDDAKQQSALAAVRAHQHAAEAAQERDGLRRRLRAAEERLGRAEDALVEGDVRNGAHHASHASLQDALSDATAARERLERREAEWRAHIEDVEERLAASNQTHSGLHALLTAAVAVIVRLAVDEQQLRAQYRLLGALAQKDAQALDVVTRLLEDEDGGSDPVVVVAASTSRGAAPVTRFRAAVHVVCAAARLQRLSADRRRVARDDDSDSPAPRAASPQPPLLLLAFASATARWLHGSGGGGSGGGVPSFPLDSVLQCYTAHPSARVLPQVRLPPAHELAAAAAAAAAAGGTHPTAEHTPRIDVGSSAAAVAAATPSRLLQTLLMAAQLDVEAAATRHVCAAVAATATACARVTAGVQLGHGMQRVLQRDALAPQPQPRATLSDLRLLLLPPRVATPLQRLVRRCDSHSRHLAEMQALVQRLAGQNNTLVEALETRSLESDTTAAALQSASAELDVLRAERKERVQVQERLLRTRAALLQERQLRRAAEATTSELRQAHLRETAELEHYRREVYALNMERVNATAVVDAEATSVTDGATRGRRRASREAGASAAPAATSALSIQVDDPSALACSDSHTPAAAGAHTHDDGGGGGGGGAQEWQRNAENRYYTGLLRGSATGELVYRPRTNVPAPGEAARHIEMPPASASPLELHVPNVVRRRGKAARQTAADTGAATPPPLAWPPQRLAASTLPVPPLPAHELESDTESSAPDAHAEVPTTSRAGDAAPPHPVSGPLYYCARSAR